MNHKEEQFFNDGQQHAKEAAEGALPVGADTVICDLSLSLMARCDLSTDDQVGEGQELRLKLVFRIWRCSHVRPQPPATGRLVVDTGSTSVPVQPDWAGKGPRRRRSCWD